ATLGLSSTSSTAALPDTPPSRDGTRPSQTPPPGIVERDPVELQLDSVLPDTPQAGMGSRPQTPHPGIVEHQLDSGVTGQSRSQPLPQPLLPIPTPPITQPVMQPAGPALPVFDHLRHHPEPAPMGRPRRFSICKPGFHLGQATFQRIAPTDHLALRARPAAPA